MADNNKSHLYFRNPQEGLVEYKSRIGGGNGNDDEDQEEEPDYTYMAEVFAESRRQFNTDIEFRHSANKSLFTLKPNVRKYFIKKIAVVRVLPSPKM